MRVTLTSRTRLALGRLTFFEYLFNIYLEEKERIGRGKSWTGRLRQVYRGWLSTRPCTAQAPLRTHARGVWKQSTASHECVTSCPQDSIPPHTPLSKIRLCHHVTHPPWKMVRYFEAHYSGQAAFQLLHPHILPQRSSGKHSSCISRNA